MSSNSLSKVRSAAIDGRVHNSIFRKNQLKQLHTKLVDKADDILSAISADAHHRPDEVKAEYCLALQCIVDHYAAINPERDLQAEYAISQGKDAPDSAEPVGVVVIEPALHTFAYSLLCALVPALAAGNCIVVQAQQTMLQTPRLLLQLISEALDQDIFYASTSPVKDADIGHRHVRVLQNGSSAAPMATQLVSQVDARVVAIVERDADVQAAASSLVAARFGLGGRSPYGPDVVLVNEWVQKDFLQAAAQSASRLAADATDGSQKRRARPTSKELVDQVTEDRGVSIVSLASHGTILSIEDRNSTMLQRKIDTPCLAVLPTTSMDDAIDLAKKFGRLSAVSVFTASTAAAKYICQFVDADLAVVNQFPASLTFGPVAPRGYPLKRSLWATRYDTAQFTLSKPQYISQPAESPLLDSILLNGTNRVLQDWEDKVSATLPEFKRPAKAVDMGFFGQGIMTGGILLLSTVIACTGVLGYYTVKLVRVALQ